jgi:hypothetical protein
MAFFLGKPIVSERGIRYYSNQYMIWILVSVQLLLLHQAIKVIAQNSRLK